MADERPLSHCPRRLELRLRCWGSNLTPPQSRLRAWPSHWPNVGTSAGLETLPSPLVPASRICSEGAAPPAPTGALPARLQRLLANQEGGKKKKSNFGFFPLLFVFSHLPRGQSKQLPQALAEFCASRSRVRKGNGSPAPSLDAAARFLSGSRPSGWVGGSGHVPKTAPFLARGSGTVPSAVPRPGSQNKRFTRRPYAPPRLSPGCLPTARRLFIASPALLL